MEVDSDSEDGDEDENATPEYTFTQVFTLCQQLEDACLQLGELKLSFDLSKRLRAFPVIMHSLGGVPTLCVMKKLTLPCLSFTNREVHTSISFYTPNTLSHFQSSHRTSKAA
ncbi:hypothetical protein BDR07DRAFT_1436454 [Suillus spraguei]|nr:hypothetical protein BDR07DRAFT_1436454 [Suillus spraguei]